MNDDEKYRAELAKDLMGYLHRNILHVDNISLKMKTWAITSWIALVGLSFGKQIEGIYWLAYAALLLFWLVDAIYKYYQEYFFDRLHQLEQYLVNADFTKALPAKGIAGTQSLLRTGNPTIMPNRHMLMVFKRLHFHIIYLGMLTITIVLHFRMAP